MSRGLLGARNRPKVYRPLIISDTGVGVNFGTGMIVGNPTNDQGNSWGIYDVIDGWCFGHANFVWANGGSGGSGTFYSFSLPVPARRAGLGDTVTGDYFIGSAMSGQLLGTNDQPGLLYLDLDTNYNHAFNHGPAWARIVLGQYHRVGSSSIPIGSNSVVVTHGFGQAPDNVLINPTCQAQASGVAEYWVDTITATQFTVHADGRPRIVTDGTLVNATPVVGSYNARFSGADFFKSIEHANIPANSWIADAALGAISVPTNSQADINNALAKQNQVDLSANATGSVLGSAILTIGAKVVQNAFTFQWSARSGAGDVFVGPKTPWAWGANSDHIEMVFAYPVA